jgi:hypothetical protein
MRKRKFSSDNLVRHGAKQEKTFLEKSSVQAPTRHDYENRRIAFNHFVRQECLPTMSTAELDTAIVDFFDEMWWKGHPVEDGTKSLAALRYFLPQVDRKHGGEALPRASRALAGWVKRAPRMSRPPFPLQALMLVILDLVARGMTEPALMLALLFTCYLRPNELNRRIDDVVRPVKAAGAAMQYWCLRLFPQELGVSSKTGDFDQAVALDLPHLQWLAPLLHLFTIRKSPMAKLFTTTVAQLREHFRQSVKRMDLEALLPDLYGLRHGGISHDVAKRLRGPSDIRRRARWSSDLQFRRYAKSVRLQVQLNLMTDAQLRLGNYVELNIDQIFASPSFAIQTRYGMRF